MRLALPILLLMTGAALAQSQPAPSDKPFIFDAPPKGSSELKSFKAPTPFTIVPPNGAPVTVVPEAPKPLPENSIQDDDRRTDLCTFDNPPPCQKPQPPKPAPKGLA